MKKITAYFNDSAKARSAAFDLSESGGGSGDILVGSVAAEKAQLSNYVFTGLFCGAALGIVLGAAAALIPGIGIYAKTGIVTGLVAGAVIGAVFMEAVASGTAAGISAGSFERDCCASSA